MGQLVEFVELGLQEAFVREARLIFSDEGRREGAAEGVFNHFIVLGSAQQHADGRTFVGFAHVAIKGFEIEFQLAEVRGLEFVDLQLERDEALQLAVIEEQVEVEILAADLQQILLADKGEIAAKFEEEPSEIGGESLLKIGLRMPVG